MLRSIPACRIGFVALVACGLLAMSLAGCRKEAEKPSTPTGPAGMTQPPAVEFANVRCPIMGTAIDPAKVPESLTREFHGKKVAFCCDGCPAAWDKLTDAEKQAKLDAVMKPPATTAPAPTDHSGHM